MFHHSGVAPKIMSLETLKEITNNFSKEQELGSGTFGIVYKGVKNGEEIAVKHLRRQGHDDHEKFKSEFENLWRLRHPNIVQLLGYCYETKHELVPFDGRYVWADNIYRALCFEYMHNGSLGNHLFDEYSGHDWQTRYKIIKGTCDGLKYLHEGLNTPMYHLDLKPDNILLDKNMVPKLADFGLSKFIHNDQTQATQSHIGTRGFLPPEYILHNLVSNKFDIFSLGVVMIMIITGNEGYFKKADMSSQQFLNLVYEKWRSRIYATSGCTTPEAKCHQVRTCIQIALDCVDTDRAKRPTIGDIVRRLNELEPMISAVPDRSQQTSVAEGPKDSHTDGVIVLKPGGLCFEIGIEGLFASARGEAAQSRRHSQMLDFNPKPANSKGKPIILHTVGMLNSMEFSHSLTKTDLCTSSATHVKKGLTKLQKATTNKVLGKTRFQMPSRGISKQLDEPALELPFPLELNKGIQCNGTLTDRCEEVNKIDGVSQISVDKEQGNVMVSGLMDSDSIVKKLNKDANSQLQKLHLTRGAKGQPKDAGAKDQKNGVCSKDAKTVLPQPMVQQPPQQTLMKELKAPQQHKLISPKKPFAVAVPVKSPKSVEFNVPDEEIDDRKFLFNIDDIPEENSGEDQQSIFDGLLDTNKDEEGFKSDGFYEPKMITKPLAMPLVANGGDNNGADRGSEIQAQIKGNGNNAVKRVSSAKENRGSHGSSGGGMHMQNVNDVAQLGVMMGLAGFPGTCQTGGRSVDGPHTSSMQHGSGGVGAAMGMPVHGIPAPGFYQLGDAAASTSMPTVQAMLQDAVAPRNTMAARQQQMAPAEQQQQPKVSRSKKMQ